MEEQLELLSATLEYNFLGSFWIHSPFFTSYEHYGKYNFGGDSYGGAEFVQGACTFKGLK